MPTQFTRAKGFAGGYQEPILQVPSWSSSNFFNGNWTYEAWVKFAGIPESAGVRFLDFGGEITLSCRDWDATTRLRLTTTTGIDIFQSVGSRWADSTWHHVAFVKNGTTITIYSDGVQIYTGTHTINVATSTATLSFGSASWPNGRLTEVRLWNVAKTGSEIISGYKIEVPANSSGLSLLYRFTDISIPVDFSTVNTITVPNLGTAGSSLNSTFQTYPPWISSLGGIYAVTDHPWPDAPVSSDTLIPASQTSAVRTQVNVTLNPSSLEAESGTSQANWLKVLAIYTSPNKKPAVVSFKPAQSTLGRFRASSALSASYSLSKIAIIHPDKSQTVLDRSSINNPSSMDITTT